MNKKFSTLILMPYLPLEGLIKFNGLLIWPYRKLGGKMISNPALKGHLDKLIGSYQLLKGNPIQNPAVVSSKGIAFTNPTRLTIAKIEALKNILLFVGILENNSWSFITSDNFEVFYQRFNVGDDGISTQSGALHRILSGGYKIGEVSFIKPEYVNLPLSFRPNANIFRALEDCLVNKDGSPDKSRVIQALNPLFNAYRNSHESSLQSRVLLLIMAFELLFGETERKNFRKNIQKYSTQGNPTQLKLYKYPIINTGSGAVIGEEQLTLNQIWAEEFYKLRHRIIHGDTLFSDDFIFKELLNIVKPREPYFYIAVNFFVVCLINKLREMGYQNILHLAINPEAREPYIGKNISGIKNERFKIVRVNPFAGI